MFKEKTEVIKFSAFMDGSWKRQKEEIKLQSHLPFIPLVLSTPMLLGNITKVFAAETSMTTMAKGEMYSKMVEAFHPLIEVAQSFAYPIASIVVIGGALYIMVGNRQKGFELMQGAALGYILVRVAPMVLDIVVESLKVLGVAILL